MEQIETFPDLESLYLFLRIVEKGSFSEVCEKFKIPKATLSRKISHLEEVMGVQLLVRSTRNVKPTELGRQFLTRANTILAALEDSRALIRKTKSEPEGLLRITAGVEFGISVLSQIVDSYSKLYPKVDIELDLTGRIVDLIAEGFDVGVRVGVLDDSSLSSKKLGSICYGMFASPGFLKKHGRPTRLQDLEKYPLLVFNRSGHREAWRMLKDNEASEIRVKPHLLSNNHWVLRDAAVRGLGIAYMPKFITYEQVKSGKLVPVLPAWRSVDVPIHALYPAQKYLSSKVRTFLDFLGEEIRIPGCVDSA